MIDRRPLDKVLKTQKCCAGMSFEFCLEGTDAQIITILEEVRALLVNHGARVRAAEMFCGNEDTQFAIEDAAAIERIRQQDKET